MILKSRFNVVIPLTEILKKIAIYSSSIASLKIEKEPENGHNGLSKKS